MKKFLLTLLCVSTIGVAFPAFAGPDWQLIEQARQAKHLAPLPTEASKDHPGMGGMTKDCMEHMDGMDGMASATQQSAAAAKVEAQAWHGIYNGH